MSSRIKLFFKNIEYLAKYNLQDLARRAAWLENMPYEISDQLQKKKIQIPQMSDRFETLAIMIERKSSVCRYGDGECNLAQNISIPCQTASPQLATRLQVILKSNQKDILICLPDTFGSLNQYTAHVQTFWRSYLAKHRASFYQLINLNKPYYDTMVSRPYIDYADQSLTGHFYTQFKEIWNHRNVVIVEGKKTKMGVGNDLLKGAQSIKRILGPELNAFDRYDKLLEVAQQQPKDSLFLICLGPTATVLAYDLALAGFQAIDTGHLDIEYEWFLRKTTERIKIMGKYVLEAPEGTKVEDSSDAQYEQEIIATVNQ